MGNIFRNLDWSVLTGMILSIIPALLCITFHELSHGFVAYRLGDNTAKDMGRLTLNPLRHIDVFGLLMMVVFGFGWAKPVSVNMTKFKNPKLGMAITALAGPVSNIVMAVFVLAIYGLSFTALGGLNAQGFSSTVLETINRTAVLSVGLAVFNLIPIPPLDGSKVLFSFIPDELYFKLMRYERFGMILLIIILSTDIFDDTIGHLTLSLYDKLFVVAETVFRLVN